MSRSWPLRNLTSFRLEDAPEGYEPRATMTDQTEPRPKPEPSPGAGPGLDYWPAYRRDEELAVFQFLALLMRQRRVIAGAAALDQA